MIDAVLPDRVAASRAAGLYVHVPFCRTKCVYCDFNCYAGQDHLIEPYVAALRTELRMYGDAGWSARTLYLGGGTPSLLSPVQVGSLVATARDALRLPPDAEVTLEANPGSVDERYFSALLDGGVNRVSIGVQSFRDDDLRRLARHHTVADAVSAYEAARAAGLVSVSLDLIYGLPEQTLDRWEENLRRALALEPQHLSLYGLVVEEGTPLARQVARGRVRAPDDDLLAEMYELAHAVVGAAGLLRYELSSWALPGHDGEHNRVYWRNEPYIGAGAGAHGYLCGVRYSNERLPARYIRVLDAGTLPVAEREIIPFALERAETVILGLRLDEGVDRGAFAERYGVEIGIAFGPALAEAERHALVRWEGNRLRLTERGRLLSNEVFQRLLPDTSLIQ